MSKKGDESERRKPWKIYFIATRVSGAEQGQHGKELFSFFTSQCSLSLFSTEIIIFHSVFTVFQLIFHSSVFFCCLLQSLLRWHIFSVKFQNRHSVWYCKRNYLIYQLFFLNFSTNATIIGPTPIRRSF